MKNRKRIIWCLLSAVLITLAGLAVNYMYYQKTDHLLLCYRMFGGEITAEYGFGLRMTHIYGMLQGQSDSISLNFDAFGCLASFVLLFLTLYVLSTIGNKLLDKRKA